MILLFYTFLLGNVLTLLLHNTFHPCPVFLLPWHGFPSERCLNPALFRKKGGKKQEYKEERGAPSKEFPSFPVLARDIFQASSNFRKQLEGLERVECGEASGNRSRKWNPSFRLFCVLLYRRSLVRESWSLGNSRARNEWVSRKERSCFGVTTSSSFISTSDLNKRNGKIDP